MSGRPRRATVTDHLLPGAALLWSPPPSPRPAVPGGCRGRAGRRAAGPQIPGAAAQARCSPARSSSIRAAGGNQRPVRVTAAGIAGEGPDIGDLGDMDGIAVDDPEIGRAHV